MAQTRRAGLQAAANWFVRAASVAGVAVGAVGEAKAVDVAAPAVAPGSAGATVAGGEAGAGGATDAQPEARDLSLERPVGKDWQLLGDIQYRTLAVRDEDPANDQRMLYRLQAGYDPPVPGLTVFAHIGFEQRFVSVQGESGVRMEDAVLGAMFQHDVSLERLGWDRSLGFLHRLRFFLPTSFRSQQDDLYLAAQWSTRARVRLLDRLFAGLQGALHYRAYEYAEQAGPGGEALPHYAAEVLAFAEYSPLVSRELGSLTLGADVYADETIDYAARDPASLRAADLPPGTLAGSTGTLLGAGSNDTFVSPHFGYDFYVTYRPPIEHLQLTASIEQVGNAVRYGESRVFLFHRDETELVLRLTATY